MDINIPPIESFGLSDIGLGRENNEDVWSELSDNHFYVLADGMGGHLAGEVAAKEAVLHFCDAIDKYFRSPIPPTVSSAKRYIGETFISANSWIRRLSKDHPDLHGMGTTLCCLLILDNKVIVGHVGDSRVYRFRKKIESLTVDHSLEQQVGSRLQARSPKGYKFILTRALGISPAIEPELFEDVYLPGDIYLMCSDGLHDVLTNEKIESIFSFNRSLKETAFELVEAAKKGGSQDNITLLMIRIGVE
jgi:protein phosphatase